ncbi:LOG family protein [Streptomyces sp. NPDC127110]|uniref:LOG family protein n=1 Tax=Streptomyces sp. NPDC127110 TaxID=3345362 RepID=UPI00362539D0
MVNADIEIETLAEFDRVVARGSLSGYRIQSVNLLERTFALLSADTSAAVFLGCAMEPDASVKVRADGALVFPPIPDLPFNPYRGLLYTAEELFTGLAEGYETTPDAQAYAWFQETMSDGDVFSSMLRSIHDDAISDALDEHLAGARVIGVLGGHAMARGGTDYRGAAELGRILARSGLTVATGGGPGAMEAANLGAYLAPAPDEALPEALELLAKVPSFSPSVSDWARAAFAVRERWPLGGDSVGIPTWFYGHEPPNAFSGQIAKYFANATLPQALGFARAGGTPMDGLLARSNAGVVFLPGAAGTVQEVFDNATPNYYESRSAPTPMVLVGRAHWTERLPVWPLLRALASGRAMESRIALVDSVEEVPDALAAMA